MIKLIIFDWDDVFTQGSTKGYYKCYHEAVIGVGVHLSSEEEKKRIDAKWGTSHIEEIKELLKDNPELFDRACEIYERHLFGDTFVNCLHATKGCQDFLSRISKKYRLALATGVNPKLLKERIMPTFAIPQVFTQVITGYDLEDHSKGKPHPYIAQTIMKEQKVSPEETIMVGDAKNDVLMARAAGIEPVVVLTGHLSRQEAENMEVRYIIEDVTKLETVLEKLSV